MIPVRPNTPPPPALMVPLWVFGKLIHLMIMMIIGDDEHHFHH